MPGPWRGEYIFPESQALSLTGFSRLQGGMVGKKRKRSSSTRVFAGRKQRRLIRVVRPLAPSGGPRGFYGLNQGRHGKELKVIDTAGTSYECSTTGTITLMNGVAQGTDFNTRVGRKFTMKSILVRGSAQVGATPTGGSFRWMIVYDKQTNGVLPAIADIVSAANMPANQNLSNRARFVVLADKTGYLEATGRINFPQKWFRRCALECTNSGTANTIGSISTGSVYLVTMGSIATGVTAIQLNVSVRIRFMDD